MSSRRQLPPQIRKLTVRDRRTGKGVTRYQVTVDAGVVGGKRRQIRRRFTTEAEARAELSSVQASVVAGTYVHASKLTVAQAVDGWLAAKHRLKPSTKRSHKTGLAPVRDELGDTIVQQLTKRDIDALVGRLRAGEVDGRRKWSARSVNHMLGLLTAVLEDQQRQGHVVRNVARLVDRIPAERPEMKTLTQEQMFQILDHECRDRHLWTLALYGLRRGEIAGLRWDNVDLGAKTVTVAENRVAVGREIVAGTPKSKRSQRTLPLPDEVVDVLRAARKQQLQERMALGESYGSGEYVACDEAGEPYHPNLLTFRWGKLLETLKIPHVRLHDARHSCATLMHLRGVPIAVIAAWMGHASAAFTLATYAHSQDDALKAAASSFGRNVTSRDTDSG
ncbi:site-specific integrase [Gordonia lacunae]|uniref:Site-specific integrase n=1 Tax=Gordonia lacunae TaxID=417102 RepID=A0A243Q762_9ACTN|nr:tyrosine-type recombinase/integrase [Gordonia lacunae]OUC77277.1 site-specific integrase [Gordonia lacunae]